MLKYSEGQKNRWSKVSKEKKSKMMSEVNRKRWSKVSKKKKRAHALKMVKARQGKRKGV